MTEPRTTRHRDVVLNLTKTVGFSACCGGCLRKLDEYERAWLVDATVPGLPEIHWPMRYCDDCAAKIMGEMP